MLRTAERRAGLGQPAGALDSLFALTTQPKDVAMLQIEVESPLRAAELEAALRRQGFRPGFPPHVAPMARAVDQSAARRMKCPGCGCRMRGSKAFHKPGGYKLLAICDCGCGEEV